MAIWKKLNTIWSKVFTFTFISLLLIAMLVQFVSHQRAKQLILEQVSASVQQTMEQAAGKLDLMLNAYRAVQRQLLLNTLLREKLVTLASDDYAIANKSSKEVVEALNAVKNSGQGILSVRLINAEMIRMPERQAKAFDIIWSVPSPQIGIEQEQRVWLQNVLAADGNILWTPADIDGVFVNPNPTKKASFSMAALLKNIKHPEAEVILVAEINVEQLENVTQSIELNAKSKLAMLDSKNRIVWSNQPKEWQSIWKPTSSDPSEDDLQIRVPLSHAPWSIVQFVPMNSIYDELSSSTRNTFLALFVLSIAISFLIAGFTDRMITRRLKQLSSGAQAIVEGKIGAEQLKESIGKDEISELGGTIHLMGDLMEHIRLTSGQLQLLLDHTDQGFLTIDRSLVVLPAYSAACEQQLASKSVGSLAGIPLGELLFPNQNQTSERDQFDAMLIDVFSAPDATIREIMIELLEQDIQIYNRSLHVRFKWIEGGTLMAVLSDQTETKNLQTAISEEHHALQIVVKVMLHENDFRSLIHGFRTFAHMMLNDWQSQELSSANAKNDETQANHMLAEIARKVHTFKGNFAQFGFSKAAAFAHEFEDELTEWQAAYPQRCADLIRDDGFRSWIANVPFLDWIKEEQTQLEQMLGDRLRRSRETELVDRKQFEFVENQLRLLISDLAITKFERIWRQLRFQPLRELLRASIDSFVQLAERYEKPMSTPIIVGDNPLVDPSMIQPFIKSLVHVFRNIVDHGLESLEEREEVGKHALATVKISIEAFVRTENGLQRPSADEVSSKNERAMIATFGQPFMISIEDDGRGIDFARVREVAVKRGFCSESDAHSASETAVLQWLFEDGFSTRDQITDLSGRGVGLSAVKAEVEEIGGRIEVETKLGAGTKMKFWIEGT